MRAAPLKGDCVVCQAPEAIRVSVNRAIWPGETSIRGSNYRAAGVRAAAQAAGLIDDKAAERYRDLDPKTLTRHADHIEDSWRDIPPGARLNDTEVPISLDFRDVMDATTRVGQKVLMQFEEYLDAGGSLTSKEAHAWAKLGATTAGVKETSRLKGRGQMIDVMAAFAMSSGHVRPPADENAGAAVEELKAELRAERALLTERAGH